MLEYSFEWYVGLGFAPIVKVFSESTFLLLLNLFLYWGTWFIALLGIIYLDSAFMFVLLSCC